MEKIINKTTSPECSPQYSEECNVRGKLLRPHSPKDLKVFLFIYRMDCNVFHLYDHREVLEGIGNRGVTFGMDIKTNTMQPVLQPVITGQQGCRRG